MTCVQGTSFYYSLMMDPRKHSLGINVSKNLTAANSHVFKNL